MRARLKDVSIMISHTNGPLLERYIRSLYTDQKFTFHKCSILTLIPKFVQFDKLKLPNLSKIVYLTNKINSLTVGINCYQLKNPGDTPALCDTALRGHLKISQRIPSESHGKYFKILNFRLETYLPCSALQ